MADTIGVATTVIATEAEADAVRGRVRAALARPLAAKTAVHVAVLNNRTLQAKLVAASRRPSAWTRASTGPWKWEVCSPVPQVREGVAAND